ncbi:hypothetical protein BFS30_11265 [Pedobacter steynii]|uniref:Uncharacterized protein n=2 Tax=Pedobacter steynii TaxID=430522 RepID=A0A1D7QG74_9SPHI|nr:hypothetical protein BFS30_11265 [Pedobacter steynii]
MSFEEEKLTEESFVYLNRQITPNGKFYIYDYSIWGPMAWSLETRGTVLLGKDKPFDPGAAEVIDGSVAKWISYDSLLVYSYKKGAKAKDTLPLNVSYKKYDGLIIKTETYAPGGGGAGYLSCDSVEFGKLYIRLHGVNQPKKTVTYPLGPISVTIINGLVEKIHVERFSKYNEYVSDPLATGLEADNYTYTLTKPINAKLFDRPGIYIDVKSKLFK